MGYLWRVRLSSFAAGAATASAAGFFLLYKDHLFARAAIAQQFSRNEDPWRGAPLVAEMVVELGLIFALAFVTGINVYVEVVKETSQKHYEALNQRISALENIKESGVNKVASD